MARARNIKPGFFKNEDLAELGPLAMLLFEGLWCLADREGRLEDRPRRIKAETFPYFDADVNALLTSLAAGGFITRYDVAGQRYIAVANFTKHQTPHIKEAASTIPAPDKHQTSTVLAPPDSLIPDTGFSDCGLSDCGVQGRPSADAPAAVKAKPRKRISDAWVLTDELRTYAIDHGIPASQVDEFAAEFKRYWQGDGRPKADWDLTFMGRVRDQAGRYQARASPNGQPKGANAFQAVIADARRRDAEDEQRRNGQGPDAHKYSLLAGSEGREQERGPDGRDLGEGPERRAIDAAHRERS